MNDATERKPIEFVGWMLWNLVHYPIPTALKPVGIFEDQPPEVRAAWEAAAAELQRRARSLRRLM